MEKPLVRMEPGVHRNEEVIFLLFEPSSSLIQKVRSIESVRWSQTKRAWYIPMRNFNLFEGFKNLKQAAYVDYHLLKKTEPKQEPEEIKEKKRNSGEIPPEIRKNLNNFQRFLAQSRYSQSTIRTYVEALKTFLVFHWPRPVEIIRNDFVINVFLSNLYS